LDGPQTDTPPLAASARQADVKIPRGWHSSGVGRIDDEREIDAEIVGDASDGDGDGDKVDEVASDGAAATEDDGEGDDEASAIP
jgi:hypothetical protein